MQGRSSNDVSVLRTDELEDSTHRSQLSHYLHRGEAFTIIFSLPVLRSLEFYPLTIAFCELVLETSAWSSCGPAPKPGVITED